MPLRKETEGLSFSLSHLSAMLMHIPRVLRLSMLCLAHSRLRMELDLPSHTDSTGREGYTHFTSRWFNHSSSLQQCFSWMHLSPCAQHSAISVNVSQSFWLTYKKETSPEPTYLWLKCWFRTSLPFSTKTSRMWIALIFRCAFPCRK